MAKVYIKQVIQHENTQTSNTIEKEQERDGNIDNHNDNTNKSE